MQLEIHIGQKIGNYRIVDEIARGAYAYVYKAVHSFLSQRPVALKILHTTFVDPGAEHDVLSQEARILEQLRHPHILALIDFGTHEGAPYIVKAYAAGGSLRDRLRQSHGNPLPLPQTLDLLHQIGEGLGFAHEHNVVHCDLKPENILFDDNNQALIADFDIARVLESVKTPGHSIGGTPSYMAPEQFQGKVSYGSDQYALACMAYEMVTGRRPFEGNDLSTLMQKHLQEEPVPPSQLVKDLPQPIEQAILRGMAKKNTARFKDIATFIKALDAHRHAGPTSSDWPAPAPATSPRRGKRLILRAPGTPRSAKKTAIDDSVYYEETVAMNAEATLVDLAPAPTPTPRKRRAATKTSTTKKATSRTRTTKTKTEKAESKGTTRKAPARAKTAKATTKKATTPAKPEKAPAKKAPARAKTEKAESKGTTRKAPARAKTAKAATTKAPAKKATTRTKTAKAATTKAPAKKRSPHNA